jgi:hypothetical protein
MIDGETLDLYVVGRECRGQSLKTVTDNKIAAKTIDVVLGNQ